MALVRAIVNLASIAAYPLWSMIVRWVIAPAPVRTHGGSSRVGCNTTAPSSTVSCTRTTHPSVGG
jgi:hypothetical protein